MEAKTRLRKAIEKKRFSDEFDFRKILQNTSEAELDKVRIMIEAELIERDLAVS